MVEAMSNHLRDMDGQEEEQEMMLLKTVVGCSAAHSVAATLGTYAREGFQGHK